jgi:hypothetical protein
MEEAAKKMSGGEWEIKTNRCIMCGECCKRMAGGPCPDLVYSEGHRAFLCKPGGNAYRRPFSCSTGDGAGKIYCSVRWRKTELKKFKLIPLEDAEK